jgi:hypothetical protein
MGPLLDKADMPNLTMKLSPIQKQLEQDEDKAFQVDPSTGPSSQPAKTAEDCFFWTKDASEHVAKALVSEIVGVIADDDEEPEAPKVEEKVPEAPKVEEKAPEAPKVEEKKDEKEAGKKKGPGIPDGTGPMSDTPQCPMSEKKKAAEEPKIEEKPKEAVTDNPPTVVNTDVLASLNYAGIEMEAAIMDEAGDMSDLEKANLAKLF